MCVSVCLFVCGWQVLTGLVDMHPLPAIVLEHRHIAKMLGHFQDAIILLLFPLYPAHLISILDSFSFFHRRVRGATL